MTDLRIMTMDDGQDADPAPDIAPDAISAPEPPSEPTEDVTEPTGADSPFYAREWRGSALYLCPAGDFPGRSHRAVVRHMAAEHPAPQERDMATRARQAGIILPRGT
jgi:hypothetical protein